MNLDAIRFDQYAGVWGMLESNVELFQRQCEAELEIFRSSSSEQLSEIIAARTESMKSNANAGYTVDANGIATIRIEGTMTKYGSSLSSAGATIRAQKALRNARLDEAVKGVMLLIDSPGGSVHGLASLAEEYKAVGQVKPTMTLFEDLGASAAYWVGSQGNTVVATPGATVGSIGVFQAVADYSAAAAKEGVKVHVIRSGQFKGAGVTGTEITAEQLAEWQRQCDTIRDAFVAAFSATRGMSLEEAMKLADGRVHTADAAKQLRLIDSVATLDQAYAELVSKTASTPKKGNPMAASYSEIVSACKGCKPTANASDAMFVADCQAKNLDVAAAQEAWMDTLMSRADAREDEAQQATQKLTETEGQLEKAKSSQGPIPKGDVIKEDKSASSGTATEQWTALTAKLPKGEGRAEALSDLIAANQATYEAYLEEFNAAHPHQQK